VHTREKSHANKFVTIPNAPGRKVKRARRKSKEYERLQSKTEVVAAIVNDECGILSQEDMECMDQNFKTLNAVTSEKYMRPGRVYFNSISSPGL